MKQAPSSPQAGLDPGRLIEKHQAGVWRYLRAMGCESSLAEDITQETFLTVLQKPFQQYSEAATAAYLRKVAFNLYVSVQRRAGKVKAVEDIEALDADWRRFVEDGSSGEGLLDALRDCLEQLTERARRALHMRFERRESRANIAADLEITEHGAKNLMQRAKKQLRDCIEGKSG